MARNFHQRAGTRRTGYRRLGPPDPGLRGSENPRQRGIRQPGRAVGRDKERDLRRAAGEYLRRSGAAREQARFDLVNIVLTEPPEIEWIKDAFPISRTL